MIARIDDGEPLGTDDVVNLGILLGTAFGTALCSDDGDPFGTAFGTDDGVKLGKLIGISFGTEHYTEDGELHLIDDLFKLGKILFVIALGPALGTDDSEPFSTMYGTNDSTALGIDDGEPLGTCQTWHTTGHTLYR